MHNKSHYLSKWQLKNETFSSKYQKTFVNKTPIFEIDIFVFLPLRGKADKLFFLSEKWTQFSLSLSFSSVITFELSHKTFGQHLSSTLKKKECISVGWVPPASVAISPAMHMPPHPPPCMPPPMHALLPCTPPATHAPCHTCPTPCHAHPLPHMPAPHPPPCMASLLHTPCHAPSLAPCGQKE